MSRRVSGNGVDAPAQLRRAAVVAHQGPGGKPVNSGAVPPILAAWDRKLRALRGASWPAVVVGNKVPGRGR